MNMQCPKCGQEFEGKSKGFLTIRLNKHMREEHPEPSQNGHEEVVEASTQDGATWTASVLDPDLQAIVDLSRDKQAKATPQFLAKMTRFAFAARGWPDEQHTGSVRDFLVENGIPIVEEPART